MQLKAVKVFRDDRATLHWISASVEIEPGLHDVDLGSIIDSETLTVEQTPRVQPQLEVDGLRIIGAVWQIENLGVFSWSTSSYSNIDKAYEEYQACSSDIERHKKTLEILHHQSGAVRDMILNALITSKSNLRDNTQGAWDGAMLLLDQCREELDKVQRREQKIRCKILELNERIERVRDRLFDMSNIAQICPAAARASRRNLADVRTWYEAKHQWARLHVILTYEYLGEDKRNILFDISSSCKSAKWTKSFSVRLRERDAETCDIYQLIAINQQTGFDWIDCKIVLTNQLCETQPSPPVVNTRRDSIQTSASNLSEFQEPEEIVLPSNLHLKSFGEPITFIAKHATCPVKTCRHVKNSADRQAYYAYVITKDHHMPIYAEDIVDLVIDGLRISSSPLPQNAVNHSQMLLYGGVDYLIRVTAVGKSDSWSRFEESSITIKNYHPAEHSIKALLTTSKHVFLEPKGQQRDVEMPNDVFGSCESLTPVYNKTTMLTTYCDLIESMKESTYVFQK